jgi:hypothetical protein
VAKRNEHAKKLAARQRQRIVQLENERRALMKAHYAGAVPLDILKEEQERIKGELATAGALMTNSEIHWESLEANLERVNNTANVSTDQESNVSGQNITVMAVE